jgi:hypothetical protein
LRCVVAVATRCLDDGRRKRFSQAAREELNLGMLRKLLARFLQMIFQPGQIECARQRGRVCHIPISGNPFVLACSLPELDDPANEFVGEPKVGIAPGDADRLTVFRKCHPVRAGMHPRVNGTLFSRYRQRDVTVDDGRSQEQCGPDDTIPSKESAQDRCQAFPRPLRQGLCCIIRVTRHVALDLSGPPYELGLQPIHLGAMHQQNRKKEQADRYNQEAMHNRIMNPWSSRDQPRADLVPIQGSIVVSRIKDGKGEERYNAASDTYENLVSAGVIDPVKVVRTALQNASSIASLLLTTEALVSEIPEDKKEMAGGGGMPGGGMGGMY